jgi:hypothetical protein
MNAKLLCHRRQWQENCQQPFDVDQGGFDMDRPAAMLLVNLPLSDMVWRPGGRAVWNLRPTIGVDDTRLFARPPHIPGIAATIG